MSLRPISILRKRCIDPVINPLSIKKTKIIKNKEDINDEKNKIVKNLGDIDKLLVNLNYNYTLTDKRLERTQEFRKNYLIKMNMKIFF